MSSKKGWANPAFLENDIKNTRKGEANSSFTIQIDSHISQIDNAVQRILKLLQSSGIDKSAVFDIRLCLEEALINAIKHGNKNKKDLPVNITYSISDDKFKISIEDSGNGFDYKHLPNPTAKENLLKTRGRGIYLIKYLMDEVSFNKNGNKITMVKYLPRGKHADK